MRASSAFFTASSYVLPQVWQPGSAGKYARYPPFVLVEFDGERICKRLSHGSLYHSLASRIHRLEELGVALGVAQLVEQEVDGIHRAHRIEDAAQHVHFLELI